MIEEIVLAGVGGQGVMSAGKVLAQAAMNEGKYVSCVASYGPEMRGGVSFCSVIISDNPISTPTIEHPTTLIALSDVSFDELEKSIAEGGSLFVNDSIVKKRSHRKDISAFYIPANDIAYSIGMVQVANVIMLGAYINYKNIVSEKELKGQIKAASKTDKIFDNNVLALKKGAEFIKG